MNDRDELHPWEQRDDEPDNAYRAFLCWRDQKTDDPTRDRTLTEAARRYTGNPTQLRVPENLRTWYEQFDWSMRTKAWDRYVQRRVDEAHAVGQEDVARRQSVSVAELQARQVEVMYEVANKVAEKIKDSAFMEMWLRQHTAQHTRAVTEFLNAVNKAAAHAGDQAGAC